MKHFFKFKKCNSSTTWVVYSDEVIQKLINSHPMAPPIWISAHLRFLNKNSPKIHKLYHLQSDELNDVIVPKINDINKDKNIHQSYAERLVSLEGIFDAVISDTPEKQLEFLNWYFGLIYP